MSLYKRGNIFWTAIWVDGVRQMRSLETSNRRRAESLEQAFKEEMHARRFPLAGNADSTRPCRVNE